MSVAGNLRRAGLQVDTAATGLDTLARLRSAPYDVLVTDIWMPAMDGLSLMKLLTTEFPQLRVFAMTGGGPNFTVETAVSLAEVWGAERVFVKPFDEEQLIQAILDR
jgi:CheY-like chemotaxis protein